MMVLFFGFYKYIMTSPLSLRPLVTRLVRNGHDLHRGLCVYRILNTLPSFMERPQFTSGGTEDLHLKVAKNKPGPLRLI